MSARFLAVLPLFVFGCATVPEPGGGGENLPNAGAGPFRELETEELGLSRQGPNVVADSRTYAQAPSILDADGDPETLEVMGYFAQVPTGAVPNEPDDPTRAIVRFDAEDGRTFERIGVTVLEPTLPWEDGVLGSPSALRVGTEVWLYYTGRRGIGLARSDDGLTFRRENLPVLEAIDGNWERSAVPASPGVVALADKTFRMFYEVRVDGRSLIGEARSDDGLSWVRVGEGPALKPRENESAAYDAAEVGSPFATRAESADGRSILRVYYGAVDRDGTTTVGLAARYGDDGPLDRSVSPVFGTTNTLGPHEPCVLAFRGFTVLYATQRAGAFGLSNYPAVAAGVAPGDVKLPPPRPE